MARQQNNILIKGDPIADRTPSQIKHALADKDEQAVALLLKLHQYAQDNRLGLKPLAVRCGIPQGTLSQLFSGAYGGNYSTRCKSIEKFFYDLEKKRIFGGCRDFVATETATSLWTIFEKTRYNRRIQIIQSEEQLGKSIAAREYAKRNNGGRTIMVTLKSGGSSSGFGVFLRDLAIETGVYTQAKKIMDLRYDIREKLSTCDLIIIDELHQLASWPDRIIRSFLEFVRIELHEDGERGIVLIATNHDTMTLLQEFRHRSRYNLGQLLGRMCNEVLELTPDAIPVKDVVALVGRYFSAKKETINKLYDLITRPKIGHFGLLDDILSRAWAEASVSGGKINDKLVLRVARATMEDIQARSGLYK